MTDKTDTLKSLWPTYALRAWLTALLAQTQHGVEDLDSRRKGFELEIARLRNQRERSEKVIASLQQAVERVDAVLRRARDTSVVFGDDTREREESGRKPGGAERTPETGKENGPEARDEHRGSGNQPPPRHGKSA
jgi:hypothetical protein